MFPPSRAETQELAAQLLGDTSDIPSLSRPIFKAYFKHYKEITCPSTFGDAVAEIESPVLKNHADVLSCVETLRSNPTLTFDKFMATAFAKCDVISSEKEYATRAIISAAFMIDCASKDYHSEEFQFHNTMRVKWEGSQTFAKFVELAFPSAQTTEEQAKNRESMTQRDPLKAWKLVKRHKIKIRPTNNLIEHLRYDPKDRVLKVFHQTMFLQIQLKRCKDASLNLGFEESLRQGILPPRLLFETLVSIHCVLFPVANIGNKRSTKLLKKLIRKHGFDPEATWVEFVRPIPDDFSFTYWGSRLTELYDFIKCPQPTNSLVSWFERHTSERNALTVAILGLFLSVLLGFLSLLVGILQLVIAWIAWKESQ